MATVSASEAAQPSACTETVSSDSQIAARHGFADLAAGSTVCIAPGTYTARLEILGTAGTAARPVKFVVGPGAGTARFTAGVMLRGTAYVAVSGLSVTLDPNAGPWAAVILDKGTHHSTVSNFTVENAYVGIAIGSADGGAGVGNRVVDNLVRDNWNTGIAIGDLSDGSPSQNNVVERNRVLNNGGHGIEVTEADYISIFHNIVSGNSTGIHSVQQGGYSGIHLYATGPSTAGSAHGVRCTHDDIAFNTVENTLQAPVRQACRDGSGTGICADGNGIQVDRDCNFNTVRSNVARGNAGDGISLFGASGNLVYGNTVRGNNQQVDRIRLFPGPAEIAVSANGLPNGSASGNVIRDNIAITTVNRVPAFYESSNAGPNLVGRNAWYWAPEADPGWTWGPVYIGTAWYSTAAALDKKTGASGNIVGLMP